MYYNNFLYYKWCFYTVQMPSYMQMMLLSSIINVNVPPYTYIFWIIDWKFYMPKIWSNINLDWWYILSLENHIPHVDAR